MSGTVSNWPEDSEVPKMELLEACFEGNQAKVDELLRSGVSVNSTDDDDVTPLQIAAFKGNESLVYHLLKNGADINMASQTGMTPFFHACREGHLAVVDRLLQWGAHIKGVTHMGASALTLACCGGHLNVVKKLMSLGLQPTSAGSCPTPLIAAALRSWPQIIGFLVQKGAPVDEVMEQLYGLTAVSCAILCAPNTLALRALLDCGADPMKKSLKKKSPIELAVQFNRDDAKKILKEKQRSNAFNGSRVMCEDIRQTILKGNPLLPAQCNELCSDGSSPLIFATATGNIQQARDLIQYGANVKYAEPKMQLTALHVGAILKNVDFMLPLINSSSLTQKTVHGMTAFDLYIANGDDVDPSIRADLHPWKSRKEVKLSSSIVGLRAVQKGFKALQSHVTGEKLIQNDRIEPIQWRDQKLRTWPVYGRMNQKFATIESILFDEKTMTPKKPMSNDAVMDVMRIMAMEAQSFAATCFYDYYAANSEVKAPKKRPDDYDPALTYTAQYGYGTNTGRPRDSFKVYKRDNYDSAERRKPRNVTGANDLVVPQRMTPRTLKKSRDSSGFDDRAQSPSIRFPSHVMTHDQLRKTTSTPQLAVHSPIPSSSFRSRTQTHFDRTEHWIWTELKRNGMYDVIEKFRNEEIDTETLLELTDHDFKKLGLSEMQRHVLSSIIGRYH